MGRREATAVIRLQLECSVLALVSVRFQKLTSMVDAGNMQEKGCLDLDDDGRRRRQGTVWTASAHIITAVIGSGVLSLAWAIAQLGWIAGPAAMLAFSFVTYYTSCLLADCYRSAVSGKRNYTYMDAVRANLVYIPQVGTFCLFDVVSGSCLFVLGGIYGAQVWICGLSQYFNLFGVAVGYTIAASISMAAIERSNCYRGKGHKAVCEPSSNPYMIVFGMVEIILSQIPGFDQLWWLSIVAAVMSFTYSSIGLTLGIAKVIATGQWRGSMMGTPVGSGMTATDKIWRTFSALGDIAFAYSYSIILIEIQDTVRSPPAENKTMKRATLMGVVSTTVFYMLCGCMGYAAFGDSAPGNLLTGFGFYNPFWLVDVANAAIVIHLIGAYQVYSQPLFAFLESWAPRYLSSSCSLKKKEITVALPGLPELRVNLLRLLGRTLFVVLTTVISMMLPFFNDVVGLMGALAFWPLTVYFPVRMYVSQKRIRRWSGKWIGMHMLSLVCLFVSVAATAGSVAGVVSSLRHYRPFKTSY